MVNGLLAPMFTWQAMATALAAAGFRTLHYDLFGRGLSDRPDLAYDLATYARQLVDLVRALGIDRAHFIGWSMGSLICSEVAIECPELVDRHVMIAPGFFVREPRVIRLVAKLPFARELLAVAVRPFSELLPANHLVRPDPVYRRRLRDQLRFRGIRRAVACTVLTYPFDAGPSYRALGRHPRPILLMWGDRDTGTPHANAQAVMSVFPRAELMTFRGARHAPQLDHPAETHAAIVEFLRR